ncbi:MAG: DUF4064 domain-containing protein [Staphylococcus rostri]|uniref:DUF4064 domain-containing protein n=1 Tax=Staphylococcus rostri TaxID=522262 RepID=UPI0026E0F12B|nr:DUF4064 domain-containing protein [Staphylococcus rostri]MDO5375863.1 DUF4064 domain-containing protein [Staphylococcus rostri]
MSDNYTYQSHQDPMATGQQSVYEPPMKPFKRTVEKVLTWIGIVLHAIWGMLIVGAGTLFPKIVGQNRELQAELMEQGYDPNQLVEAGGATIATTAVMAIIPFILALVAVFLFRKNILAGILLVLAAVTGVFLSGSFIAGLLWIIAGIMLFVRKPKNPQYVAVNQDNRSL